VKYAAQIVERFDREIRGHFEFEEQVLFPALEEFAAVRELVAELMEEHRRMYGLVGRLRSGAERGWWRSSAACCGIMCGRRRGCCSRRRNSPGTPVLYTSSSLALACLEVIVHV
jgi:hypothetical protein